MTSISRASSRTMAFAFSMVLLVIMAQSKPFTSSRGQVASLGGNRRTLFGVDGSLRSTALLTESLRGGASDDDEEEEAEENEYDESDEEIEEEEDDEEIDEEEESEEEEEEYDDEEYDEEVDESGPVNISNEDFVEPYFMSPMTQMYTTFGAMMLSRRVDLFTPLVVQIIRFAFIAQIVIQQMFILYVRIMAKKNNDRTPVTTKNPLSGVLQSQLEQQGGAAGGMVKNLASSFLSSETTVMEYDMRQAASMQGSVVFSMGFMWLMHFKLEKVQPLLIQVATGFIQLAYSPLFQVYVMGRNLERPFKAQASAAQKMAEAQKAATEENEEKQVVEDEAEEEEDESGEDSDEEEDSDEDNDAEEEEDGTEEEENEADEEEEEEQDEAEDA